MYLDLELNVYEDGAVVRSLFLFNDAGFAGLGLGAVAYDIVDADGGVSCIPSGFVGARVDGAELGKALNLGVAGLGIEVTCKEYGFVELRDDVADDVHRGHAVIGVQ